MVVLQNNWNTKYKWENDQLSLTHYSLNCCTMSDGEEWMWQGSISISQLAWMEVRSNSTIRHLGTCRLYLFQCQCIVMLSVHKINVSFSHSTCLVWEKKTLHTTVSATNSRETRRQADKRGGAFDFLKLEFKHKVHSGFCKYLKTCLWTLNLVNSNTQLVFQTIKHYAWY